MQLFYYQGKNFGDELNPYIFNKLVPKLFTDVTEDVFIGIGTLLGFREQYGTATNKYIFSSGFGYGKLPKIDDSFNFICVRGPLTAEKLGLKNDLSITDGAVLIKTIYKNQSIKKYDFSFMPHWESDLKYDWKNLCKECGINYIDPTSGVELILDEINSSKVMISEAMHGAIIADTFRVPWISIKAYGAINNFKWNDWLKSIGMEYNPAYVPTLYDNKKYYVKSFKDKTKDKWPTSLMKATYPAYNVYRKLKLERDAIKRFNNLKKEGNAVLSKEGVVDMKIAQLEEKLFNFYSQKIKS